VLIPPRGFSLAELLVAVVIACAIGAAVMDSAVRQQRFFAADARAAVARGAVRQAVDVLSSDLRALTPSDGDLYVTAADHVDLRMLLGASVLCTIGAARDAAVLPPLRGASVLGLTSWVAAPLAGDTVLVFDAGGPGAADDRWARHVLASDPIPGGACPVTSGFTVSAAEAASGWSVRLSPALALTVTPGAAVRFVRRARFELYRAADSKWYLGFSDCLSTRATPCSVVQPVSGPYDAAGIQFAYHDSLGAAAAPAQVARIVVSVKSSAAGAAPGGALWRDSTGAAIAVRN
jgi:prepilin-type N-terminal cleavage/methylation domain-containing protein